MSHRPLYNEQIQTTPEHPFWIQNKGWQTADKLVYAQALATRDADRLIRALDPVNEPVSVYNFTVEPDHTYFVGKNHLWVHNANKDCGDRPTAGSDKTTKWEVPGSVTDKLPAGWDVKANKKGVGTRYQDPNNPGNGVRIDQGNANHSLPSQQVDHVIVRRNGQVIGRNGKPIQGSIKQNGEQAHIPLNEYKNWKSWDAP